MPKRVRRKSVKRRKNTLRRKNTFRRNTKRINIKRIKNTLHKRNMKCIRNTLRRRKIRGGGGSQTKEKSAQAAAGPKSLPSPDMGGQLGTESGLSGLSGLSGPLLEHKFLDYAKTYNWSAVKKILDTHPDLINVSPKNRWTALHQAVHRNNKDMVEYLLKRGANTHIVSKGQTPKEVPGATPEIINLLNDYSSIPDLGGDTFDLDPEPQPAVAQAQPPAPAPAAATPPWLGSPAAATPQPAAAASIINSETVGTINIEGHQVLLVLLNKPDSTKIMKNQLVTGIPKLKWRESDVVAELNNLSVDSKARCMVVLPSQINGAEHPSHKNDSIPRVDVLAATGREHWEQVYMGDPTGGPIGQLTGSREVAREVVRISEANIQGRTAGDMPDPLPINYLRHVINGLIGSSGGINHSAMFKVDNGYFHCQKTMTTEGANELLDNLHNMGLLMSIDNPVTGRNSNYDGKPPVQAPKVDMVYASAIPLPPSSYPCLKGGILGVSQEILDLQETIGLNIIYHQYRLALTQACHISNIKGFTPENPYLVFLMPLGGKAFANLPKNITLAAQNAIASVMGIPGFYNLDIKMLFYHGNNEATNYIHEKGTQGLKIFEDNNS